jgi:hypothetical protein
MFTGSKASGGGALETRISRIPRALHGYMQPYAVLDQTDRERVRAAIRTFIAERCVGETVEFRTPVLVAIGYRI